MAKNSTIFPSTIILLHPFRPISFQLLASHHKTTGRNKSCFRNNKIFISGDLLGTSVTQSNSGKAYN